MDYEARARELALFAQNTLQPLWNLAEGDSAEARPDLLTLSPSDVSRSREQFVTASGYWAEQALDVLKDAPSGPYVDHLGTWYDTIGRQRSQLVLTGWGGGTAAQTFVQTLPDEISKQAASLTKTGAGVAVVLLAVLVALNLLKR